MSQLHVDSVLKNYGGRSILTDVYLACQTSEIIGLLGRNGSGKSSLLKIIFGSISAEHKFVRVDNQRINNLKEAHRLINYLPQHGFLPKNQQVAKLMQLFCTPARAAEMAEHELFQSVMAKKSHQLSGGEQRLVEIGLLLFSESKFTLLDEPFNGVAPLQKEAIKSLIQEQSLHKGFIITDHDYRNVIDISTRLTLLYDGGTKPIQHPEELKLWGYLPPE